MSHFIIQKNDGGLQLNENTSHTEEIAISEDWSLKLIYKNHIHNIKWKGSDFVCALGYLRRFESPSIDESLNFLLELDKIDIGLLKKQITGQYILIIKKDSDLFILNDFLGARNIFYNSENGIITSSFSLAETLLGTEGDYLNTYKVFEYLAAREILYPCWLNRDTLNKKIKWLLPYEYLHIDLINSALEVKSSTYYINNYKENNLDLLSDRLILGLKNNLFIEEFKNANAVCSLTGGRDSRLIATLASLYYRNLRYRTAISILSENSRKDFKVARKVARANRIKIDLYTLNLPDDEKYFRLFTEEMTPIFNITITPIILNANKYDIGFGGVYGTELFTPVSNTSRIEYKANIIKRISSVIKADRSFIDHLSSSIENQFEEIKHHYNLEIIDDKDYIRLFQLFLTARYSSFILSAFNMFGYQFEPFGTFSLVEIALQIDPIYWGNKKSIAGDALIEKMAMEKISPKVARILAYASRRPVAPLSLSTSHLYFYGYLNHLLNWIIKKTATPDTKEWHKIMPDLHYLSNGWEAFYINRLKKYALTF